MRKTIPYVLGLALIAATIIVGSATATSSPVNLTVQDTGTDATGPFVAVKWTMGPGSVNHIDLYRSDHTTRWDSVPNSQTTYTNHDQVVIGTTYTWTVYACTGTAECKTSTASDTAATDTVTVKAGQPACSDLADNDVDGKVDLADPTCTSSTWDDEANAATPTPTPTPSPTPTPTPTPTPQTCSYTATAGQSFASAIAGLGSSGTVLCLPAGTYTWGDYVVPAGKTITGSTDAGVATVLGQAVLNNSGVTLSNLVLRTPVGGSHAAVDGKASNVTLQNVDVDTNHQPGVQGMIVGGTSIAPSGFKVLDSVIHGSRGGNGLTDSQVHGIYWQNGSGAGNEIGRVWVYDVSGYGFHFYAGGGSPATNVLVHNTVLDDSITRGNLVTDGPTGNTYRDSVVTDSPSGVVCRTAGNTLTNVRSGAGFQGCTGTGLVTADTVFDNEAARNYGNDTSGHFVTGPLY
jgi:hypothetical protein